MRFDEFLKTLNIDKNEYGQRTGKYAPVASDRQMKAFYGKRRLLLDILVYGFAKCPAPTTGDTEAYSILKKKMNPPDKSPVGDELSAQILFYYATKFKSLAIKRFLDLGCGSCRITEFLADKLNVVPHGSDLEEPFEQAWAARSSKVKFKYLKTGSPLGHPGKWDLITAIMVLHHVPNPEETIRAIAKSLNPGGLFIIKEHDCTSAAEDMLVDIEHSLYIVQNNDDWKKRIKTQYIKCFNWIEWAYKMNEHGLLLKHYGPWGYIAQSYGTTRKCVMVFEKVNN